ncbi:MAG: major capsid protein [Longimicrobiales bacterium]
MADLTYSTGALVRVVRNIEKPVLHFRDRYFPNFQFEEGEHIIFDVVNGMPRIAPFVHPKVPGKVMDFRPHSTKMFKPAYVKPKHELDPSRWLKRLPGEAILGSLSNQQRRDLTLRMILEEHEEMLSVREEAMCAEIMRTGKVTVEGEGFGTVILDFQRDPALTIAKVGAARWSEATATPMEDIEDAALVAREKSGGWVLTEVTMSPDAWKAALARFTDEQKKMLFDSRRGSTSTVELGPRKADKRQFQGQIGDYLFWTYQDTYTDLAGDPQDLMPSGTVIIAGAGLEGTRAYGAIQDPRAGFQAIRNFPKVWIEEDPPSEWVMSQSAPLMVPFRPNASVGMTVFAEA